jgi:chemotaxis protein histidine kinase CheA
MKITLDDVASGYNLSKINENFQKIEDVLNDEVLFRYVAPGEPNALSVDIDADGKTIYNVPSPTEDSHVANRGYVDGLIDVSTANTEAAETAASNALASSNSASSSAATATQKANEASASAASALTSANNASASAGTASAYANSAADSADSADSTLVLVQQERLDAIADVTAIKDVAVDAVSTVTGIQTYLVSDPYDIGADSDFGSITDNGNTYFSTETGNRMLTMSKGTNSYDYGALV